LWPELRRPVRKLLFSPLQATTSGTVVHRKGRGDNDAASTVDDARQDVPDYWRHVGHWLHHRPRAGSPRRPGFDRWPQFEQDERRRGANPLGNRQWLREFLSGGPVV